MARGRSGYRKPPYLSLKEALRHVQEIQQRGAGNLRNDALAEVVGNTAKSSSFRRKVIALKDFGLVNEIKSGAKITGVQLTPLGKRLVLPANDAEKQRNALAATRNVPLFNDLYEKLMGQALPETQYLQNIIRRDFQAYEADAKEWAVRFREAMGTVGVVDDRNILVSPSAVEPSPVEPQLPAPHDEPSAPTRQANGSSDEVFLRVPIEAGGHIELRMPRSATAAEVEMAISLLTSMRNSKKDNGSQQ